MLKNQNNSQVFVTKQDLSCVWIVASEAPGAPLVCIWTDAKMRAFEEPATGSIDASIEATVDSGPAEEGPETFQQTLTVRDVKHVYEQNSL